MVDWQRILQGAGETAQGMAYAMTVNRWLQLDDQSAFSEVVDYVNGSAVGEVDTMDAVLLQATATNFDLDERRRLVKFYALFKTAEYNRFGQFRGFPA
ncbi:hypothetical protein NI17_022915 [Thermobifida halotolerans]|uniref:Uncharacterized protein n=1 Tax=Thermobifida halotolerans TaxID=483545 RepID=A0A399FZV2_9ACTN|nr:hypothetical protein [Thermobifida halotolerans]UOE19530.1 hypothetical protein NI17_022915 [Thermobifida halotolerans]